MRITPTLFVLAVAATLPGTALAQSAERQRADAARAAAQSARVDAEAAREAARAQAEGAREELRAAREELRALSRRVAELSMRVGAAEAPETLAFRYLADPDRAMIGVVMSGDEDGVVLRAITPGGPAEKAGLRPGDRIVAVNGKAIDGDAPTPRGAGAIEAVIADDARVRAARGLIGELSAGDKVRLTVERDGKRREVEVVAERRASQSWPMWAERIEMPEFEFEIPEIAVFAEAIGDETDGDVRRQVIRDKRVIERAVRDAQRVVDRVVVFGGPGFGRLRLSPVNPDLGKYFGTDQGVLVLEAGEDDLAELRAGDVILSIAGRKVDSTSDAMRAFADQEPGAAVNVEVMRDKRRQVLVVEVPERRVMPMIFPVPPTPPAPPAPPAAPKPGRVPAVAPPPPAAPPPPTPPAVREVVAIA